MKEQLETIDITKLGKVYRIEGEKHYLSQNCDPLRASLELAEKVNEIIEFINRQP